MRQGGFSLLEVVVALGILLAGTAGGAQLIAAGFRGLAQSRLQTQTAMLASARMEQLLGLAFAFDEAGQRVGDATTNLAVDPPAPGGPGLTSAGTDSIAASVAGYVDYADRLGRWLGDGPSPPTGAVFVRRWSIDPWQGGPDLLVLRVVVRPAGGPAGGAGVRVPGESRLVTLLARVRR